MRPAATIMGIEARRVWAAGAVAMSAMFLLCGYEFVRSVSQSLFVKAYGAESLPAVMALGPVGVLLMIYGYGRILSVTGAKRAILLSSLLTGLAILVCHAAIRGGSRAATAILYVLREAYIVLLVEQIWAFINSTVSVGEGRRLNGPVCGIASLGAIAGGLLVRRYAVALGSNDLLLFAALSLAPTGLMAALAYQLGGEPQPSEEEAGGRLGHLGLRVLLRNPTLRRLALLVALTQVVSTAVDLQFNRLVAAAIPGADERTAWLGGFYGALNGFSALFQFVVAPLLLRFASLRAVHLAVPAVHLGTCALALAFPLLLTASAALMCFKVLDYSVFRAAKELLYIPLSYDARYRAKEIIDAFGYRFAKGVTSLGFMFAGAVSPAAYPVVALAALLGWIPVVRGLTRPRAVE
jgi:ATP:ADP antiporter, AAA family